MAEFLLIWIAAKFMMKDKNISGGSCSLNCLVKKRHYLLLFCYQNLLNSWESQRESAWGNFTVNSSGSADLRGHACFLGRFLRLRDCCQEAACQSDRPGIEFWFLFASVCDPEQVT